VPDEGDKRGMGREKGWRGSHCAPNDRTRNRNHERMKEKAELRKRPWTENLEEYSGVHETRIFDDA
jgi:hypothetical protein